ncbi:hypothetical protein JTB14_038460 [Gonioctena quinquepunctata]|nr:hypothetical protein JTB14_038460 [Gonioctena quinquepunctata]
MDRDVYRGLTVILKNNSNISKKADEVNELFKIFKIQGDNAKDYLNRLIKYNKEDGLALLIEFANKWGPTWKVMFEEPLSSEEDSNHEEDLNNEEEKTKEEIMDTFFSNIKVSKKFQLLADPVMEEPQGTKDTKRTQPPPIIIKDKKNWPAISQLLKNLNLKSENNFNDRNGIKVIYNEMEAYQKCLKTLEQYKIQHSTFRTKTDREIRAIFKGVVEDFSTEDITEDLRCKGFHPRVVARFQNRDGTPMSIILCIVPASDQPSQN